MKKGAKYTIAILAAVLFVCVTALIRTGVRANRHTLTCSGLCIEFKDSLRFVDEADIKTCLERNCPVYIGRRLDSIDLCGIENVLNSRSAILRSEAWTESDGNLHVSITQRSPVAKITTADHSFYIDDRGFIFPMRGECTVDIPVIEGAVPLHEPAGYKGEASTPEGRAWVQDITRLISYMDRQREWKGRFGKIRVDAGGDLVLVPAEGQETFIFGKCSDIPAKFARIDKYYRRIRPELGEDRYRTVNVKYKGQIVCRKK